MTVPTIAPPTGAPSKRKLLWLLPMLGLVIAVAFRAHAGQGPVTWGTGANAIFNPDGSVCTLLDSGTLLSADAVPSSQAYKATCAITTAIDTNATVTACLQGSTDTAAPQLWTTLTNSCQTFTSLDGGVDGGVSWVWSQGYVDPWTRINMTVNNSDGGMLCCTYSAQ